MVALSNRRTIRWCAAPSATPRYEGSAHMCLLNELYAQLRLYTNFFQPVMKLLSKQRTGAKVKKIYDRPRTPYQRLCDSTALSKQAKQQLRAQYASLNPAELKRNIVRLQSRLFRIGLRRPQALSARGSRCAVS